MKDYLRFVVGAVVIILLALVLDWAIMGNQFFLYKAFAPKMEQARRETFEQSKAYNDGMIQELRSMQFDYVNADDAHKIALKSIILHRIAGFPEEHIPTDLRQFVEELKKEVR